METENEHTSIQNLWDQQKRLKVEIHHNTASIQKRETTQIQKLTLHIKRLEEKKADRSYTQQKNRVN